MPSDVKEIKRKLKYGPRMSRQLRAEYLLTEVGVGPRTLTRRRWPSSGLNSPGWQPARTPVSADLSRRWPADIRGCAHDEDITLLPRASTTSTYLL
jgi:hypothetical protein